MAEAIVMLVFLLMLLIIQIHEQRKITIQAKRNFVKMALTLLLAFSILIIFWPNQLADQIKLVIFVSLILSAGLLREGLADDHLVKLGVLSGDYSQYEKIQLEDSRLGETFVTFYKGKNSHFSTLFTCDLASMENFFEARGLEKKLILGEMPETVEKIPKQTMKNQEVTKG
ncbi:hypothetical protein [Enterococcus asini]|uniref:Transcriptional regulator n=1 Tax=Enterococcus asini TaxID=57732 RepID=A0AAW8U2G0_9ENTE|nr:hypothetical protein [Enterococcus asini]MDT2810115.1 hypothetical protein [Enterococcus asini]